MNRSWIHNVFSRPYTRTIRKAPPQLRLALEALEDRWVPSTFTVSSIADSGPGSLRAAISLANSTAGPDTINFDSTFNTPQMIALTSGQLELTDTSGATSIIGPAAGVTVSGGGLSRVFQVDGLVTASISGVTISGGKTTGNGGGLRNVGTATLINCTVSGNSANSGGGLVINSPTGTTTLTNCTVSGNSASGSGGGLFNNGTSTTILTNCTVSGNSANSGGGLFNNGTATLTLTNTIVAGNTGGNLGGSLTVTSTNNLIGGNPLLAPLHNYGGPTQTMALLPGSPAIDAGTSGAGIPSTDQRGEGRVGAVDIGAFESQGFTLTPVAGSTPQTSPIGTPFANPLAVTVTANNPIEPVNGGVVSFANSTTHGALAILSAPSAVIGGGQAATSAEPDNAVGSYAVVASARGASSVSFALTNAGPVFASLVVNTTSDSLFPGAGLLSLREAIAFANIDSAGISSITFDKNVFATSQTITLTGSQLELSNTSETEAITGPAAGVMVDADGLSRVFQVDGLVAASISGLTISGGKTTGNGGGLINLGTATLTNCTVSGNSTGTYGSGGGLSNLGTATLTNCTVSGNSSGNYSNGGGLYNYGTATLTNCTVSGNSTGTYGSGGGLINLGTATLTNCTVSGNSASNGGGGVATGSFFSGGTARTTLTNCIVSHNSVNGYGGGGGVANYGTTTLTNCTVSGNSAAGGGGGVLSGAALFPAPGVTSVVTMTDSTVTGNSAGSGGGVATFGTALYFFGSGHAIGLEGATNLNNCTVSGNTASGNGGGLDTGGVGTATLTNCTVSGNSANNGGGLFTDGFVFYGTFDGTTNLSNCTVSGNSASGNGGGLDNTSLGSTTVTGSNVKSNSAVAGGGIANQGTLIVASSTINNNQATSAGGGISTTGGSAAFTNCVINANRVSSSGTALGGGIDCENTLLSLTGCTVNANQANGATALGGGIYALNSTVNVKNSVVNGNKAKGTVEGEGGGIYSLDSILTLIASNVKGNKASTAFDDIFAGL